MPYGVAALSVAVAVVVRLLLDPVLEFRFPFATLFFAVLFSAWVGGYGPALLASGLGAVLAARFLLPPRDSMLVVDSEHQMGLVLYLFTSLGIALLGGGMQSAQSKARRHARDAERQRELLQVTLRSISDGVIATDVHGNVTFLNPVAERLTGWSREEAHGQPLSTVFHIINEDTRQSVENPAFRALREGVVVGLANHTVLIARDGVERLIDDGAAPIRDAGGTVVGVVLIFRDVSELRQSDETRRRLAAIVASSDDAIVSKSLDGIITSWNAGAERLYGYSAEEVIGKPFSMLAPEDRVAESQHMVQSFRKGERLAHVETVRRRKDGRHIDVSASYSPIRDEHDRLVGISAISRDITDRKRYERNSRFLAEASEALAVVVDDHSTLTKVAGLAVPFFADWCAVDMLNEEGGLERVAVAHVDPDKVALAHDLHRRFPPRQDESRGVWKVLRTGAAEFTPEITDELLVAHIADPELLQIIRDLGLRSHIAVPLSVRKRVVGVITFIIAESGRRYSQGDLELAADLARRAGTAIENARLYAELREADRRKNEFLAMLGHELRNPLAPIRNAIQIFKMPDAPADMRNEARVIAERQIQHMTRLVDDLLDVSRIMRGKIELRKGPMDLASAISQALEAVRPVADANRHQIDVSLPEEPLYVLGDVVRLAQIFGNLLNNAAKYTHPGGRIWVSLTREGDMARVSVRDSGIGMAPEMLPHVFDIFVQADHRTKVSQGGMGLGLSLVRSLTELHGGDVEARSEGRDKGSEFIVRLPVLTDPPSTTNGKVEPDANENTARSKRHVLVVDDNIDAAKTLADLLRLEGHETRVVHDGAAAIAQATVQPPDIAFLDIGMPGLDGYEVARRLRAQPKLGDVCLVALTGWGQDDDRRRTQEAGFDYHLVKPVEPELVCKLARQAKRR